MTSAYPRRPRKTLHIKLPENSSPSTFDRQIRSNAFPGSPRGVGGHESWAQLDVADSGPHRFRVAPSAARGIGLADFGMLWIRALKGRGSSAPLGSAARRQDRMRAIGRYETHRCPISGE